MSPPRRNTDGSETPGPAWWFDDHEKRIRRLEKFMWGLVGLSAVAAYLGNKFSQLIGG